MAKKPEEGAPVRARVLVDCAYGKPDEVIDIAADLIDSLAGVVDADPAAVEYAESLTKE